MTRNWWTVAGALFLPIGLCACTYAKLPPVVEAGRRFSPGLSEQLHKGDDAAQVRTALGEPYGVEQTGTADQWRYYMRIRGGERRWLFGFIRLPDSIARSDYDVMVTFREGRVETVSSTAAKASPPATEWASLLEAFTRHDARGESLVRKAAGRARESAERDLAEALLDEWGPPLQSERLRNPVIVDIPRLATSRRKVTAEVFLLNVHVGSDGHVVSAALMVPSHQQQLSREVLANARATLFRPAFRAGRFVESDAIMQCFIELK